MRHSALEEIRVDEAPQARAEFSAIFAEHAPYIWRALRNLGVREPDVEDVCQEVFVVVHRKLAGFEGRSSLRTWIYGIALRVVADYRKKAHRRYERLLNAPPEASIEAAQEQSAADRQLWLLLHRLLDTLSEERRQIFVLYEIEQLSMSEIATILDCPLQTAYSRLEAARKLVQQGMAAWRAQEQRS